jgi:membrane protease subunit (stomatin/prohibitin family)
VYFINLTTQMGVKWGTSPKVRFIEPTTGLPIEIGASGEFNIRVANSKQLILKLVGTTDDFSQLHLNYFKSMITTYVKTYLAKVIKEKAINILEIDEYAEEIGSALKEKINASLDEYGLVMPEFFITSIATPDDDPNFKRLKAQKAEIYLRVQQEEIDRQVAEAAAQRKYVEAQTQANLRRIEGQAKADTYKMQAEAEAAEMKMKGYTYQQETARQVGLGFAENQGQGAVGGAMGNMMGLGVGIGAMGNVLNMTREALSGVDTTPVQTPAEDTWDCECGNKGVVGKFCNNCGKPKPQPVETWDCECGNKNIVGNFCNNCGKPKPKPPETWDCECGNKNIVGNFCNNCGKPKPKAPETWDCECGTKGITGNFCTNCGKRRVTENE